MLEVGQVPKLEIGSGMNPTPGYEHLDRDPECPHLEYCGDFRALFVPDVADPQKNRDVFRLQFDYYEEILAIHYIEHVEWIYQEAMFQKFFEFLKDGGVLRVVTPNLDWIVRQYCLGRGLRRRLFRRRRQAEVEWWNEHPKFKTLTPAERNFVEFSLWVNFKLYSGCSPATTILSVITKSC